MNPKYTTKTLFAAATLAVLPFAAPAATVNFDGAPAGVVSPLIVGDFEFTTPRIVNGNCGVDNPCLALNDNETTIMTLVSGGLFSLTSMWFQLLGKGTDNTLIITADTGATATFPETDYPHNNGFTIDFAGLFDNVSSITFSTVNGGNVRIDDLDATPAPVPVPAAIWMLLAGMGGIAAVRRKRA